MADEKNMQTAAQDMPAQAESAPDSQNSDPDAQVPPNQLSKEEQMARFEEDLKYNDWGHQPC